MGDVFYGEKEDSLFISSMVDIQSDSRQSDVSVLQQKLDEIGAGVRVERQLSPEEFQQKLEDLKQLKTKVVRVLGTNDGAVFVEHIFRGVGKEVDALISQYTVAKPNGEVAEGSQSGMLDAAQLFEYIPDPDSVARGDWRGQWNATNGTWNENIS